MMAMTLLAKTMEVVFILAVGIGMLAHIYGSLYWFPMWRAGFRKLEKHKGYRRKAALGYSIFGIALAIAFAAGAIAERWGGGWH